MNKELIHDLQNLIDGVDVVSFDIFDTLLLRIVNTPETIFECLGEYAGLDDFKNYRIKMQNEASKEVEKELHWPHPTISQIYDYIKKQDETPYDDISVDWDDIRKKELVMEQDALRANPEIKEVYEYAIKENKRVIATSDMYIEEDFLKKILEENGYVFDDIYDSANLHKTKWIGDLFEYVIETENVPAARILHIGDNESSDCQIPRKYGIKAYHYPSADSEKDDIPNPLASCVEHGVENILRRYDKNFWEKLGMEVGGPMYIGLMQWFEKNIFNEKYDRIFFLSRDGYNLYHLFDEFTEEPITYVYTSRRSMLLAGITQLDQETLAILPPFTYGQTIREVLDYIGVVDIYSDCINSIGYKSIDDVIREDDIATGEFKKIYRLKEKQFLEVCKRERESAQEYYEKIGFYSSDSIVFDCGWNGSSQYLMDRFLECTGYNRHYKFLYAGILDTPKSRQQLSKRDFKAYMFDYDNNHTLQKRVKDSIVLLELFFGAPEKSIYIYDDGKPVYDENDEVDNCKKDILCGIMKFVGLCYSFISKYNIVIPLESAMLQFIRLMEKPTEEEAIEVGNIKNADTFVKKESEEIRLAYITEEQYADNPNIEIWWIAGLLKRNDVSAKLKKKICDDRGIDINKYIGEDDDAFEQLSPEQLKCYEEKLKADYNSSEYGMWRNKKVSLEYTYNNQKFEPLLSVVIPVYNVASDQLIECIESICNQTYYNWELFLVDDNSSWESVRDVLRTYEDNEKINVIYRKTNGNISVATNDGIFAASGEFVAFIDCDDVIEKCAFSEMVYFLNEHPQMDFVYSDEDKLSEDGTMYHSPFFKPDWSPDTILSLMYTNHLAIYRREIVCQIGGLRTEYNGAQDYDFTLRFMELSDNKRVGHVPKVLYHWRERKESIASSIEAKPYAIDAMKRLKEETFIRRGIDARIEFMSDMYQYQVIYNTTNNPLVSIIIPSKDNPDLLRQCIGSLIRYTNYSNYEIIVVDNGSKDENKQIISRYLKVLGAKYIYRSMEFNFSKMCNLGVSQSNGEYILLLNDDIEIINEVWLERMLGQAMQSHTGAVGAKLLYPNSNRLQHIGIGNLPVGPCHMCMGMTDDNIYYFGRNRLTYNWLAVTAACLLVNRKKYDEVGGLDEELTVAYNDVDFCFKLFEAGYYNVTRMDATLYHHESFSRGYDDVSDEKKERLKTERDRLFEKHNELFAKDPFHNINLGVDKIDYSINMYDVAVRNYDVELSYNKYPIVETNLNINVDDVLITDKACVRGWAYSDYPEKDLDSERFLLLKNKAGQEFKTSVNKTSRLDTAELFGFDNLTEGFECEIDRKLLATNIYDYQIGLLQKNENGDVTYVWSDTKLPRDGIGEINYTFYSRKVNKAILHSGSNVRYNIEKCSYATNVATSYGSFKEMTYLEGWAFVPGKDSCDYRIEIGVADTNNKDELVLYDTIRNTRYDVANSIPTENCYLSGFKTEIPCKLESGEAVYIVLTDLKSGEYNLKRIVL